MQSFVFSTPTKKLLLQHIIKKSYLLRTLYTYITGDTARAYQALQVFRLGSVLLLSVILVQLDFTSEQIGDFEWFIFISNVASFFWGLGLKNAFMSYFPKQDAQVQKRLIFNLVVVFLVLGSTAYGVIYAFDFQRLSVFYQYLPWLFCFLVLGTTASLSEHVLLVQRRSRSLFFYGFISYSGYLFGLAFLAFYTRSIQSLFIGLAIWAILRFVYFVSLLFREGELRIDPSLLLRFSGFALPLILHVLLGSGMEYVDGFLVNQYYERSDFAYFRYGARELPINTIFISALASAFIPLAVTNLSQSLADIKERTSRLMNFLYPFSMLLILISPILFTWVYSEEYMISAHIFNIYLLILGSRILLPQIIIYAKHKNNLLMIVAGIEFVVNIGLSIWLMRYYGLYGIAFATVLAYLLQKLILIAYNYYQLQIPVSNYLDWPKYLLLTFLLYLTFVVTLFLY